MKWFPLLITLSLCSQLALANEEWQQQEQAREQQAQQDLASVSTELNSARARLAEAQRLSKELASQFASNEKQLVELNTRWEQASGDIHEFFAVTRQGASDAVKLLGDSSVQGQYPDRLTALKAMAQDKQVPDRAALALLPALPDLADATDIDEIPLVVSVLTITAMLQRVIALPEVDRLLSRVGLGAKDRSDYLNEVPQ